MTVAEIITELTRAWAAGDGEAWAANFAEDAMFVDVLGNLHRGRNDIARSHQWIFDTIYRDSRIVDFVQVAQRPVGDDTLVVHTTSTLRVPAGPRAGDTPSTQTMIVKNGQIIAFQNTIQGDLGAFSGHQL
ncbi:MAG TPA: SgcJ/EcaC family oxidoreductase [Pseudonocardiaceae bacterium]|nr:SgcJ/EcaC family oxidoreductase [Pseudonocardiaceae bacterium]